MNDIIIGVDFDGTIVEHKFPEIGEPLPAAFDVLKQLKRAGYKLMLWTCREDLPSRPLLTEATEFCRNHGIVFDYVNASPRDYRPEDCLRRKPDMDVLIDDRVLGGFAGWDAIGKTIFQEYTLVWGCSKDEPREHMLDVIHGVGETKKSKERRLREGWFEKYAPEDQLGLDLGCKMDPLNNTFRRWDLIFGDGDATFLEGLKDNMFQTVYASHILEHILDPMTALKNWYRVLKPGGNLIIVVPHRDLYERKKTLPSTWNPSHHWFFLPDKNEEPCTLSLKFLLETTLPEGEIISYRTLDEGYDHNIPMDRHPVGEFSLEAILRKPLNPTEQ